MMNPPTMKYSRLDGVVIIVLLVLALLAYGQVATHGLNGLDDRVFLEGAEVSKGLTKDNVSWALTTTRMSIWHPVTWWSYQAESSLFGADNHGARHIVNLLIHLLSVVVCYVFMRFLLIKNSPSMTSIQNDETHANTQDLPIIGAAFVAFLFAFHPQHVQVVAWLSERKELLAALFTMLSIYAHMRDKLLMAIAWFVLALMSKASALPMAFVIVVYDVLFSPLGVLSTFKQRVFYYIALLGLALSAAFYTLISQQRLTPNEPQLEKLVGSGRDFYEWAGYIILNLGHYIKTLFLPWPLPIFMHRPDDIAQSALTQSLLIIAIAAIVLFVFRKNRWVLFGSAWFGLFWLPTSGVVDIGEMYVADRYMYQAHIGAFIVIFAVLSDLFKRISSQMIKRIFIVTVVLSLSASWYFSRLQTSYWETNTRFYERELAINPVKDRALVMLGRDHQRLGNLDKAFYYFGLILEKDPYDYYANLYSGFLNMKMENYPLAAEQLMLATQYGKIGKHHYIEHSYEALAWVYWQLGKRNIARRLAIRGLKVMPNNEYLKGFANQNGIDLIAPKDTQVLPR